jgi:hypothetical protein
MDDADIECAPFSQTPSKPEPPPERKMIVEIVKSKEDENNGFLLHGETI